MNNLNRASLDTEIESILEKMNELEPTSEEYDKLVKRCDILMRTANEDDKIQAETELEKMKLDIEESKSKENGKWQKIGTIVTASSAVLASVTTITCYIILCVSNKHVQERSIMFEMDGFAHTDRSDKFMQKVPLPRF